MHEGVIFIAVCGQDAGYYVRFVPPRYYPRRSAVQACLLGTAPPKSPFVLVHAQRFFLIFVENMYQGDITLSK